MKFGIWKRCDNYNMCNALGDQCTDMFVIISGHNVSATRCCCDGNLCNSAVVTGASCVLVALLSMLILLL